MRVNADPSPGNSYDSVSIAFHWVTVAFVLTIFMLSLSPGVVKGSIVLHKTLGLMLLGLVPLRIVWRLTLGRRPRHSLDAPILRLAAGGAHFALYGLLLITPLLGWYFVDAKGMDLTFFGMPVPVLADYDRALAWTVYAWKKWMAYSLLALLLAHAAAAIGYHAIIRKDGVLRSMMPGRAARGTEA